jgi:signal transduction histidine kinase
MRTTGRGGDAAIVVLGVAAMIEVVSVGRPWWAAALVGTWLLPLIGRRRFPVAAPAAAVVVMAASVAFVGDQLHGIGGPAIATISASGALGAGLARRDRRPVPIWLVAAALLGSLLAAVLHLSPHPAEEFALVLLLLGVSLAAGWMLPRRLEDAMRARNRADRTEQSHEVSVRAAIADERAAIARELHDIVAHGVNVMTVQAAAARTLVPTDRERARTAIDAVSTAGTSAVLDLRRLCNVLGGVDDPRHPQPCLADLDTLVSRFREAGLRIDVVRGELPRHLPAGVEATGYRIVQEALTNTLKHAGRTTARVDVDYDDGMLRVSVVDAGTPQGVRAGPPHGCRDDDVHAGQGLPGMHERVALYQGELTAGPHGPGYRVAASLPVTTP